MNIFKRLLLFTYLVIFFVFFPVLFCRADTVERGNDGTWISRSSLDGLVTDYGTYGDPGNSNYRKPWYSWYFKKSSCMSVFMESDNNPKQGVIYIFTESNLSGQNAEWNYAAHDPGVTPNLEYRNQYWSGFRKDNVPNSGSFEGFNIFKFDGIEGDYVYYCTYNVLYDYETMNTDFIVSSWLDLYNQLVSQGWEPGDDDNTPLDEGDIYFYLKTYAPSGMLQKTEYTITWDTSRLDPKVNLSKYGIGVYICGDENALYYNFKNKKAVRSTDQYPYWLNGTAFSFTYQEIANLFSFTSFPETMFYIYLNIVDENNNPISDQWINWQVVKRVEITDSEKRTWDGSSFTSTDDIGGRQDGVFQYTDDRPNGVDDNGNGESNSNGSQVSQQANGQGVNNYTPTNPEISGVDYGTSLSDLTSNLSGLLSTLGNLPFILQTVITYLPSWLITLFSVSLGLIIVIGTAKLILR